MQNHKLMKEFPVLEKVLYFNTASIGIAPDSTISAMHNFLLRYQDESICDEAKSFDVLDSCRLKAAKLINCKESEIAFQPNTSYGINTIAHGLPFEKGDEIIIPKGEFPANVLPWKNIEGVKIIMVESKRPIIDEIIKAINPRTRAICISAVNFSDGYRYDLAKLSQICHENDLFFAVDAIQAIGNMPIDVSKLGIDLMTAGAQKWQLTPWGAGFLYVSEKFQDIVGVTYDGWLSRFADRDFSRLLDYELPFPNEAVKYEVGSPVFPSLVGYENSLGILLEEGIENINNNSLKMADILIEQAKKYPNWKIVSPVDSKHRSAIVSIKMPDSNKLYSYLRSEDVIVSLREGAIRFAFHLYNYPEQLPELFKLVDKFYAGKI